MKKYRLTAIVYAESEQEVFDNYCYDGFIDPHVEEVD